MKHRSTLTTSSAFDRGNVLGIGPDTELVKVLRRAGVGPYTVTVRRYRWSDRAWDRVRAYWRRLVKPLKDWRYARCDTPWCLRAPTLETDDYDTYCSRHAPEGAYEIGADE